MSFNTRITIILNMSLLTEFDSLDCQTRDAILEDLTIRIDPGKYGQYVRALHSFVIVGDRPNRCVVMPFSYSINLTMLVYQSRVLSEYHDAPRVRESVSTLERSLSLARYPIWRKTYGARRDGCFCTQSLLSSRTSLL